jgi:transformation/transcription domain-associated protein
VNEQNFPLVANSARLLSIVIFDKPDSWYVDSVKQLQALLEKGMTGSETVLHDILRPLFERLLHALPGTVEEEEAQGDIATFYSFLDTVIEDGLQRSNNISGTLNILQSYVRARPKVLERFAEKVVKAFARICKEHLHAIANKVAIDPTARLIKLCLNIFRVQVPVSLEHRKPMMLALVTLAEKSPDPSICRIILTMSREWVFHRSEGIPMMKEKANLLLKMTSFENKRGDDDLFADYLTLIYDIYTEPSFRRTDLATRLEPPFFLGCRVKDPVLRSRFTDLLNSSLDNTLAVRVQYVLGTQSWEYHAEHNWIPQALDLLLGCIKGSERLTNLDGTEISPAGETVHSPNRYVQASLGIPDANGGLASHFGPFGEFDSAITGFVDDFIRPLRPLLYLDLNVTHSLWISVFKTTWRCLSRKEQIDATRSMISLLGKEYHNKQMESPNNVIRSLLAGVLACSPPMSLPPFLVKYLGKTFNAWHTAIEILQGSLDQVREEENIRESIQDGLIELFAELSEDDMFYGLWRRRCLFTETNAAISFEQNGMWPQAETMYEAAQIKARAGSLPYSEAEYCMWEDHWILAAQKLQQWDVLTGFAESERNHDLLLECAWRLSDWSTDRDTIERTLEAVSDVATPRRRVFEAFTALMRVQQGGDRADFLRILEDAMQLSLRKWAALPSIVSMAHVPLLQHFQQFVELQEAAQIFQALQGTTSQNLEKRSSDLKVVLQAWRERLPNLWDDISVWSDLVAWRQHVFSNINKAYLPLIPVSNPNGGNAASNGTYGYRGYHETAWIINRFAHVARKHQLQEVCHNALTKIYTLPNIEISEAFLKLREQARCHYQNPNELAAGLEVINNTNLIYFSPSQKAEFYTLKGMFIAKLGHNEDANSAFASAVQMDLSLPKAWAEWGRYNDRLFKDAPTDMGLAGNAVSCYLQAAGLYKCAKTRPLLIRILWLLSLDDTTSTVSRAFEAYKGDLALWYWITLIPQLLLSLSHREARHARHILMNIAKLYPQVSSFSV